MKIAYYTHPFLLDCDFPLIRELQHKGHEVKLFISLAPHSLRASLLDIKEQRREYRIIPAVEFPEMLCYSTFMDIKDIYFVNRKKSSVLSFAYFRLVNELCHTIRQFDPDVVHITYPLDSLEMLMFQFRKRMILVMHDPFPHSGKKNIRSTVARYLSIKLIHKIVLLNEKQREQFGKYYHISDKRIFTNKLGSYDCIKNFDLDRGNISETCILFFGYISPYKGLEYLCKAMMEVHKSCPNLTLIIAGGGKLYFDFTPYQSLSYITLVNRYVGTEELAKFLSQALFVVCPYKDATQSGVIMTAFAMECPVLASNVGALSEQIEDGKTGILVPPCDVKRLSDEIVKLATNPKMVERMRNNIRDFNLSGENSWGIIADKYIECYNA